jgi:hypothetical protein
VRKRLIEREEREMQKTGTEKEREIQREEALGRGHSFLFKTRSQQVDLI